MFNWRKLQKFRQAVWIPHIKTINEGLEEFFSKEALDDQIELYPEMKGTQKTDHELFGKEVRVYVPLNSIKKEHVPIGLTKATISVSRQKRTQSINI